MFFLQKYYHGESIAINVLVDNNTNKTVKKIKISGEGCMCWGDWRRGGGMQVQKCSMSQTLFVPHTISMTLSAIFIETNKSIHT